LRGTFREKSPSNSPQKLYIGAKVPFARGISVFCAREACFLGFAGVFVFPNTREKSIGQAFSKACGFQRQSLWEQTAPFASRARAGVALCAGVFLVLFLRLQPPKKERSKRFRITLRARGGCRGRGGMPGETHIFLVDFLRTFLYNKDKDCGKAETRWNTNG
jgi:hypothetical protein